MQPRPHFFWRPCGASRSLVTSMIRTFYRSVFFLTVAALAVALPHALSAQSKIAYLDAGKLLKRMPEAKDAESRMTQLIAAWTKESGELQAEIDRKQSDF